MADRGVYRGIHSSLLDDPDFHRLSPQARHVLLTARLCVQAGPAAIFRYYPELLMAQTGYTAARLETALMELERENWTYRDGVVLWVRNGLRYDPYRRLSDKKHVEGVVAWLKSLPHCALVARFCDYYQIARPSQGSPETHRRPFSQEKEKEEEKDKEKDQEKDNTTAPAEREVPWGSPEDLVSLYNHMAPPGHPRVSRLTPARRHKARRYLTIFPEQKFWIGTFSELGLSSFLRHGSKDSPGFRGDFDWLLTKGKDGSENAVKVAEGKYRDKEHA